jgi:predicted branched-subunit amino acid permease
MARVHAHTTLPWPRPALRGGGLGVMVQRGAALLALAVTIAFIALIFSARQQRADARAVAESAETVA